MTPEYYYLNDKDVIQIGDYVIPPSAMEQPLPANAGFIAEHWWWVGHTKGDLAKAYRNCGQPGQFIVRRRINVVPPEGHNETAFTTPNVITPLKQAIELQIAHQIERRKVWKDIYMKTIHLHRPSSQQQNFGGCGGGQSYPAQLPYTHEESVAAAAQALAAFDKQFPTIHAQ